MMRRSLTLACVAILSACSKPATNIPTGGDVTRGREAIAASGCGSCHRIPGVENARGEVGPPLSGLARRVIIAGMLPNSSDNMIRWIQDPPSIDPRTAMPNLGVSAQSARDMAAYLYTLR
jgi:cytochrome c2